MMKTTIHSRLEQFIAFKKMSNSEFGKAFRASRQEISNWCKGTKMNVYRIGDMLEAYPDLNGHWFLTGEGQMLTDAPEGAETQETYIPPECRQIVDELTKAIDDLKSEIIALQREKIAWMKNTIKN